MNKWVLHVKNYCKTHNMSYINALKSAECKDSYKKGSKEKKESKEKNEKKESK